MCIPYYHIFTGKIESVKNLKHCQNESFQLFVLFSFAKSFYMATLLITFFRKRHFAENREKIRESRINHERMRGQTFGPRILGSVMKQGQVSNKTFPMNRRLP